MSHTLDSLHRATIANPEDRTIRLVYADALDEAGGVVNAARAEFIRAQIELENVSEGNPHHAVLATRRDVLFDEHWLTWWRPMCEAAGFPSPHIPGKWLRYRRSVPRRPRRPKNWPYTITTPDTIIHANDYNLAIRFAGGFQEEIRFFLPRHSSRWSRTDSPLGQRHAPAATDIQFQSLDGRVGEGGWSPPFPITRTDFPSTLFRGSASGDPIAQSRGDHAA